MALVLSKCPCGLARWGIVETTAGVASGAIWPKRYPKRGGPKRVLEKGRKKRPPKEPKRAQKRPKRSPKAPPGAQRGPKEAQTGPKKAPRAQTTPEGSQATVDAVSYDISYLKDRPGPAECAERLNIL